MFAVVATVLLPSLLAARQLNLLHETFPFMYSINKQPAVVVVEEVIVVKPLVEFIHPIHTLQSVPKGSHFPPVPSASNQLGDVVHTM